MDLSENRTSHPNLLVAANACSCTIGTVVYKQSIIIPSVILSQYIIKLVIYINNLPLVKSFICIVK